MKVVDCDKNKNNLISYYDLINLIRENKQPKEIKLFICGYSMIYFFAVEDGSYIIKDRKKVKDLVFI